MESLQESDAFICLMITNVLCLAILRGQRYALITRLSLNSAAGTEMRPSKYYIHWKVKVIISFLKSRQPYLP